MENRPPKDNAPPPSVIKEQAKQPHFWLAIGGALATIAAIIGIITRSQAAEIAAVLVGLGGALNGLAYQRGSRWNPPRRPWSRSERVARGLPPEPSPPPKTIQTQVVVPPAKPDGGT